MKKHIPLATVFAFAALSLPATADEVRLKDGTVIKGTINGVEAGVLSITPGYNADASVKAFKFKIEDVLSFNSEEPLYIGTSAENNTTPDNVAFGKVEAASDGIRVHTSTGVTSASVTQIKAAWRTPEDSPHAKEMKKLERHWEYELFTDITGKTGNSEQVGVAIGFSAINSSKDDTLKFYGKYNYAKTDGLRSADDLHAGVDYTSYFARPLLWYTRSDNGFDKVKLIDFFSVSAVGGGITAIDQPNQRLEFRLGVAYRYESYDNGTELSKPGLDVGIDYSYTWSWGKFVDKITYTPVFEEFANYLLHHEAYLEIPLANSENWKVRTGISNDYNSRPLAGVDRLDTTYFVRVVLSIK